MTAATEIPTWEGFLVPVLRVMSDAIERSNREVVAAVLQEERLTPEQLSERLDSGDLRADNRIGWAMSFLTRAGALSRPRRARYVITDTGRALLRDHPDGLRERHLKEIPAYAAYTPSVRKPSGPDPDLTPASATPEHEADASALDPVEQIESGIQRLNADVAGELLGRLRESDPTFFERAVLAVLVAMGYGGAEQLLDTSEAQEMGASTASSIRIRLDLNRSTSKPSATESKALLVARRSRPSLARCRAIKRRGACSSRPVDSRREPSNTRRGFRHAWFSSTGIASRV